MDALRNALTTLRSAVDKEGSTSVAYHLGIVPTYLYQLMRGMRMPKLPLAMRIRARYGIPLEAWAHVVPGVVVSMRDDGGGEAA